MKQQLAGEKMEHRVVREGNERKEMKRRKR